MSLKKDKEEREAIIKAKRGVWVMMIINMTIQTTAEADKACLQKMASHIRDHHVSRQPTHQHLEVHAVAPDRSACSAAGWSTGGTQNEAVELCGTEQSSCQGYH